MPDEQQAVQNETPQSPDMGGDSPLTSFNQPSAPPPSAGFGGKLKQALQRFAYYGGQAGMAASGLPTDFEIQKQKVDQQLQQSQIQHNQALTQQVRNNSDLVPMLEENGQPKTDYLGQPVMLPRAIAAQMDKARIGAKARTDAADTAADAKLKVAQLQFGPGLPLDSDVAHLAGYPELAGKPVGKAQFDQITKTVNAKGYRFQDLGSDGLWLIDRSGNKIKRMGSSPMMDKMFALGSTRLTATVGPDGQPVLTPNTQAAGKTPAAYDPTITGAKAAGRGFAVGTESDQVQSFRTFAGHADDLSNVVNEYRNTKSPLINRPLNWLRQNSGDPKVAQLLTALEAPRKEFETFLLNNRALYSEDRAEGIKILNSDMSPAQLQVSIRQMMNTAAIRFNALQKKADESGIKRNIVDPETQEILKKFGADKHISKSASPSPNGKKADPLGLR